MLELGENMSYVKYREDDLRISGDRIYMRQGSPMDPRKNIVRYYECKYCHQIFTSKKDLNGHIKTIHNIVRPLIVINEKVVGDHTVLQYLQNAKILMYGFEGNISIGGDVLSYRDEEDIDITALLKTKLQDCSKCEIVVNDTSVLIEIHPISVENNSSIKATIEDWQNSVAQGIPLSTSFQANFSGGDLLFLRGIYNYYLACTAKHHKASRYDDAYAALSRFHDLSGLGKCVLKAIAFRRNWIDTLRLLSEGENDIFSTACEYFGRQQSNFEEDTEESTHILFVEDGTKLSLELIELFQKGKYSEIKVRLAEMGDIDDIEDPNLAEQLRLLRARIARAEGDTVTAARYYERLITPAFRDEYRRRS